MNSFWSGYLQGIPVALAAALLLLDRLKGVWRPDRRAQAWLSSLALAVFVVTLAAGVLAEGIGPAPLRPRAASWLRLFTLLNLALLAESVLTRLVPARRVAWLALGGGAVLLAFTVELSLGARPYPWMLFIRESRMLLVLAALHGLVIARLAGGLKLAATGTRRLPFYFSVAAAPFALHYLRLVSWGAFWGGLWRGLLVLLGVALLIEGILTAVFPRQRKLWVLGALVAALMTTGWAVRQGNQAPVARRVTVPIAGLAKQWDGFTLVAVTDLHLRGSESIGRLESLVNRVNALQPQLVVLVGDTVERAITPEAARQLARLSAQEGVFAVTGNHEFYGGAQTLEALPRMAGIPLLRNRWLALPGGIQLAGVDDPSGWRFPGGQGFRLRRALRGVRSDRPVILLSHTPRYFDRARHRGVMLQVSGHTHSGQLAPFGFLTRLWYRYPFGLALRGNAAIYTSSGAGWGTIPLRLGSRSEIVQITLVAKAPPT